MTESDAKTKWCPFTRVGEQASGAAENRPDGSYQCIASACMAWRGLNDLTVVDPKADRHVTLRQGFCGLAGAPQ